MKMTNAKMEKQVQSEVDYDDFSSQEGEATSFLNRDNIKETARRRGMTYLLLGNLFIFMMSALTLVCAVYSQRSQSAYSTARLMDEFGVFSPAMHVVEYEEVQFKLPNPLNSSKYVGVSEEVNKAWLDIAYVPDQMVSLSDFPKLNKPTDSLQVTDTNTGETGYRVGLEVFHQLQCLNLLRMATYPTHYTKLQADETTKPDEVRAYLDHCIETLRTKLMCASDVSVFTYRVEPSRQEPLPDYEANHVCRTFESVRRWAEENAVPDL